MKDWTVYLLKCGDGTLYCGATNDIERRMKAHSSGKGAKYTRGRLPVSVFACRTGLDKSEALRLEAKVKKVPRERKPEVLHERE